MKQSRNSSLVETIIAISPLKLLSALLVILVIYGGDSHAFERTKYKVIVTRPGKNVTTQLRVYAEDAEEARENVALNGWQILSIEPYTPGDKTVMRGTEAGEAYKISITTVGNGSTEPADNADVQAGDDLLITLKPGPCDKLSKLIYNGSEVEIAGDSHTIEGIEKDGFLVAIFEENGSECSDNGILSKNLKELQVLYFALGKFQTELTSEESDMLKTLSKDHKYVIIGHTDDLKVTPNKKFTNNFDLSVKRAQFISNILIGNEISDNNIKIVGLGPSFPAAPNKKEGQPQNRRAVLYERTR